MRPFVLRHVPAAAFVVAVASVLLAGEPRAQESGATGDGARVAWRYAPAGSSFAGVAVRDGTVFAIDRGGAAIHALDAATGTPRWRTTERVPSDFGYGLALSPRVDFAAVVVGCDSGLLALDPATGKQLWHSPIDKGVAGPACTETVVFAGGADGHVHACELKTGRELWRHEFVHDRPDDPPGVDGEKARFPGRPARPGAAITDGQVVAVPVFDQCRVLLLDAATGKRRWDFRTEGWMYGTPGLGALHVLAGSQDRHVYGIDRETGKLAWKVPTGARVESCVAMAERFAYVGSCDGHLYAIDHAVGRVVWRFAIDKDAHGRAPLYGRPLVAGDTVYLAAMRGVVHAIDRAKGTERWQLRPVAEAELDGDLATDGTLLFATTRRTREAGQSAVVAIEPPRAK
jgi:outer membrane protein assembly factor BamB